MPAGPVRKTLRSVPVAASSSNCSITASSRSAADEPEVRAHRGEARLDGALGDGAFPQPPRLGTRGDAELLAQGAVEPLELSDGGVPVAGGEVLAHELDVGALVGGVELDELAPASVEAQQFAVQLG